MQTEIESGKIDFRVYIGMVFFRWQVITLCFLYSLLGGVLYINLAPKVYLTTCKIMIHKETNLEVNVGPGSPLQSFNAHTYFFQSDELRRQVAKILLNEYGSRMGGLENMVLPVDVTRDAIIGSTLNVSVKCGNPTYGEAFMTNLVTLHQKEWDSVQRIASEKVSGMLQEELDRLQEKIKASEDDYIEYQRLHDIARAEATSSMESQYLSALMGHKNQLTTELMLMEAEHPALKNAGAAVISDVARLTRETGAVKAMPEREERTSGTDEESENAGEESSRVKPRLPEFMAADKVSAERSNEDTGWRDLRVKLTRLQQREKELVGKFRPEHPELVAIQKEIAETSNQLDVAAQVEIGILNDRHKALTIALNAIETAEYNWKAKSLLASMRRAELKHLAGVVERFEENYRVLYSRLHDMRISEELKAEYFRVIEPATTGNSPVWPDPLKVLLVSLAVGLSSGFGLALLIQVMDNKVQSIKDVENELGVPFLGGIPYWADSGLDNSIRPIVIEEDSIGAVEAYRALRTLVVTALNKNNEKILILTSADSKEGKTLTSLNLAIMLTQMEKKVLLIDMDMRRGRLHKSLGLEKEPGVSNVMKDGMSMKKVIVPTRFNGLHFLPTGATVENSAELFQTSDVRALLDSVKDEYDYIVIDTSPVLRVTDTVILSTLGIGGFLFVARVNRTPKPMIKYAMTLLKDARILGVIMNSIELHKISSIYYAYQYPNYAYYSNAYRYGYDYRDGGEVSGVGKGRRGKRHVSWDHRLRETAKWLRRTFLPMD